MINDKKGDLPIGFTMSLDQDMETMTNFASLPEDKRDEIIFYIEGSTTGDEAKSRISEMVTTLHG